MPVAYGGGVKSEKQALEIFSSGIEKISVNSLFFENKEEIKKIINSVGSQSLVVTFDIKKIKNNYHIVSHRGKFFVTDNIHSTIERAEQIGVGEIIINNVDRDGTMNGYDKELIKIAVENTAIPIIGAGGAGTFDHLKDVFLQTDVSALACGSLFNFGDNNPIRAKAFLTNYSIPFKVI